MALVIPSKTKSRSQDPTASLREALTNFEDSLNDEQKNEYRQQAAIPDASSVLVFVAKIDQDNGGKMRRCVAPRLCAFLDATQQFTTIVDTFVSSNPRIAALVWGGVRTTILTATNVASYFEKVTSMIMMIGKSCPTYQQFGQLYPGCVGLQGALCDYYAIIVHICAKVIEVSQRTAIVQTFSSIFMPFESDFKELLQKLDQATQEIKLQSSLASKQADDETRKLLDLEVKNATSYRRAAFKFHEGFKNEQSEAHEWHLRKIRRESARLRASIRANLSATDHAKPWKRAVKERVPSTAEWLQQEPEFRNWHETQDSAILWCSGTMGVGKTVLMSNVVAQLHTSRKAQDVIAYFFCCSDDQSSLQTRNIIGSLASQILDSQINASNYEELKDLHKASTDLDNAEIFAFLLTRLEASRTYHLLLDGLDECDAGTIRDIATFLDQICLLRDTYCKILCASRPELENLIFNKVKPQYRVVVSAAKVDHDMDQYINTVLSRCLEEEKLKLGDPKLIIDISDALRKGYNGMFLWTRLLIDEICAQGNDNAILEALKHLPRGLSELFDIKLKRIRAKAQSNDALRMLQFCGVARYPLTILEYREALSIKPGQEALDRGKFCNDMRDVINDCCGLIFMDEEDDTVHYVHHSVQQHLFRNTDSHKAEFDVKQSNTSLGLICTTYLNFVDFQQQLTKFKDTSMTRIQPIQLGIVPVAQSNKTSGRMALWLLRHRQQLQHITAQELEQKAEEVLGSTTSSQPETNLYKLKFEFLPYSKMNWIYHLSDLHVEVENEMWRLVKRCMRGDAVLAARPWMPQETVLDNDCDVNAIVQWLIANANFALLLYLVRQHLESLSVDLKHQIVHFAVSSQREDFLNVTRNQMGDVRKALELELFHAIQQSHVETIRALLKIKVNPSALIDLEGGVEQSGLQAAAAIGNIEIVQMLIATKCHINGAAFGHHGRTALQAASQNGHLDVVEMLLAAGAHVNAQATDDNGRTALQAAAEFDHHEVARRLLDACADVNAAPADYRGLTALQAAAQTGSGRMVDFLIRNGADVNGKPAQTNGRTALQAAVQQGHTEIVAKLLAANADVNAPGGRNTGRTALQVAAATGNRLMVQKIMDAKLMRRPNLNAEDKSECLTAHNLASIKGHTDVELQLQQILNKHFKVKV